MFWSGFRMSAANFVLDAPPPPPSRLKFKTLGSSRTMFPSTEQEWVEVGVYISNCIQIQHSIKTPVSPNQQHLNWEKTCFLSPLLFESHKIRRKHLQIIQTETCKNLYTCTHSSKGSTLELIPQSDPVSTDSRMKQSSVVCVGACKQRMELPTHCDPHYHKTGKSRNAQWSVISNQKGVLGRVMR